MKRIIFCWISCSLSAGGGVIIFCCMTMKATAKIGRRLKYGPR